jgi:hypothetical protein
VHSENQLAGIGWYVQWFSIAAEGNFVPVVWDKLAPSVPLVAIPAPYAYMALAVLAGTLSWHLIERGPIQRLKKFVPYAPSTSSDVPQKAVAMAPAA